jgi:hypothetical protein
MGSSKASVSQINLLQKTHGISHRNPSILARMEAQSKGRSVIGAVFDLLTRQKSAPHPFQRM